MKLKIENEEVIIRIKRYLSIRYRAMIFIYKNTYAHVSRNEGKCNESSSLPREGLERKKREAKLGVKRKGGGGEREGT